MTFMPSGVTRIKPVFFMPSSPSSSEAFSSISAYPWVSVWDAGGKASIPPVQSQQTLWGRRLACLGPCEHPIVLHHHLFLDL